MLERSVVDLYEQHAHAYDRQRSRSLQERVWLDRFLAHVYSGATILDMGCGTGEPIARYLIDRGCAVVGVDASPAMIDLCRARFPECEWLVADMLELEHERRFEGILAWDSLFHLNMDDQRRMLPWFARHALPGAPLMFTSGPAEGEVAGVFCGEDLYHASLAQSEYEALLKRNGFVVREYVSEDRECGGHTVWLATLDD